MMKLFVKESHVTVFHVYSVECAGLLDERHLE